MRSLVYFVIPHESVLVSKTVAQQGCFYQDDGNNSLRVVANYLGDPPCGAYIVCTIVSNDDFERIINGSIRHKFFVRFFKGQCNLERVVYEWTDNQAKSGEWVWEKKKKNAKVDLSRASHRLPWYKAMNLESNIAIATATGLYTSVEKLINDIARSRNVYTSYYNICCYYKSDNFSYDKYYMEVEPMNCASCVVGRTKSVHACIQYFVWEHTVLVSL